jgi:hypothetical protein
METSRPAEIEFTFPPGLNEQERPMLWFGSWLIGDAGEEGPWFHSGRGAASGRFPVPPAATGLRIRRWPSDGFDAEYADILSLDGLTTVDAATLEFDREQAHSLLRGRL